MRGTVTRFFRRPGKKRIPYGFIDAEGKSYYFALEKGEVVSVGDVVEFEPYWNDKGRVDTNVKGISYEGTNNTSS